MLIRRQVNVIHRSLLNQAHFPIARLSPAVRYSNYLDISRHFTIDHAEGKAPEQQTSSASCIQRPHLGSFGDFLDSPVKFGNKGISSRRISFPVPFRGRPRFGDSGGMELNHSACHYCPAICRRASAQGTSLTLPSSISLRRSRTSSSQAASAPSSII